MKRSCLGFVSKFFEGLLDLVFFVLMIISTFFLVDCLLRLWFCLLCNDVVNKGVVMFCTLEW